MTASQLRRGRLLVALAIAASALMLLAAIYAMGPALFADIAAEYGRRIYQPEQTEYCPGEVLRASYTVQPISAGQVEIMGSWRNVDRRTTLLPETMRQYANIWEAAAAPITATLAVTIPSSPQMIPGSSWMYVRSVRKLGQPDADMFAVPFSIANGCD